MHIIRRIDNPPPLTYKYIYHKAHYIVDHTGSDMNDTLSCPILHSKKSDTRLYILYETKRGDFCWSSWVVGWVQSLHEEHEGRKPSPSKSLDFRARRMRLNSRIPRSYLHAQSLTAKHTGIEESIEYIASEPLPIILVGKCTSTAAVVGSGSKVQIVTLRWRARRDKPWSP